MTERTFDPTTNPAIDDSSVGDALIEEAVGHQVELDLETRVVIHNDEVTPYDYVMYMLADLFMLSEEIADHIAWSAHTKGSAVVVVRPRDHAKKLVVVAHGRAKVDGFPLKFSLE